MKAFELRELHQKSINHRDELHTQDRVGCFGCMEVFEAREIHSWTDQRQTALCPYCCMDMVVPCTDPSDLADLHTYVMGRKGTSKCFDDHAEIGKHVPEFRSWLGLASDEPVYWTGSLYERLQEWLRI